MSEPRGGVVCARLPGADLLSSERALLDGFRRGDAASLERVYRAYVDAVTALVRGGFVVGEERTYVSGEANAAAQQDLVQEVFTRAFTEKARQSYDGLRPYLPFLLRITKNVMIDTARRTATRREQTLDVDFDALVEGNATMPTPLEDPAWSELMTVTRAFLATQGDEVRTFVELRFDRELGQVEVAATMGITRRRVRTLESTVQEQLSAHLRGLRLL